MTGFTGGTGKIGHVLPTYKKCEEYNFRFETASNNLIGLLTVGNVIKDENTVIGDYVIEWRKDSITGEIVFISGVGTDPEIQAVHPFANEPVVGGNLHAVIKYVVINGIRYSSRFREGQHSPDLNDCLGVITVQNMDCSTVNDPYEYFNHKIEYTAAIDPLHNAERTVRFNLDLSTHFISYMFEAQNVADRVTFSYVHISDEDNPVVLSDWIVGIYATTNYTTTPPVLGGGAANNLRMVIALDSEIHAEGDYLLIHVTPRVQDPSATETNWKLTWRCLETFDCYTAPVGARTPDASTVEMIYDPEVCRYIAKWMNQSGYVIPTDMGNSFLAQWYSSQYSYAFYDEILGYYGFGVVFNRRESLLTYSPFYQDTSGCQLLSGSLSFTKSGEVFTLSFTNITDYNEFKADVQAIKATSQYTSYWSDDPTTCSYYSLFRVIVKVADSCDESNNYKQLWFNVHDELVFNDGLMSATVDVTRQTNGMANLTCTPYESIDQILYQVNLYLDQADFSISTNIRNNHIVTGLLFYPYLFSNDVAPSWGSGIAIAVQNERLLEGCVPSDWTNLGFAFGLWISGTVGGEITNTEDPINNFKLTNYADDNGVLLETPVVFYEKVNGVQLIPAP